MAAWRGNTSIIELLLKENALITAESVVCSLVIFLLTVVPIIIMYIKIMLNLLVHIQCMIMKMSKIIFLLNIILLEWQDTITHSSRRETA